MTNAQMRSIQRCLLMVLVALAIAGCDWRQTPTQEAVPTTAPEPSDAPPTPPADTPVAPPTAIPTAVPTEAPPTAKPAPLCTVDAEGLRLRAGPGTVYATLGYLGRGDRLEPLARGPIGGWLHGRAGGEAGWLAADYLSCNLALEALAVATAPPTPTVTPSPTPGPLDRDDPVPDGVAAQLGMGGVPYVMQGTQVCRMQADPEGENTPRLVTLGPLAIGERSQVCLLGFRPGRARAEAQLPDGRSVTAAVTIEPDGVGAWPWLRLPGTPLGKYRLRVTQGRSVAEATLEVIPAPRPRLIIEPQTVVRGQAALIGIAGVDPGSPVALYLYEDVPDEQCTGPQLGCARFKAVLSRARADRRGEYRYALQTTPDDPPGSYRVAAHVVRDGQPTTLAPTVITGYRLVVE